MVDAIDFRVRPPELEVFDGEVPEMPAKLERYDELFDLSSKWELGFEDLLSGMDDRGVERAVIQAEYEPYTESVANLNETVADLVSRDDRFVGFAAADPRDPVGAARTLERAHDDLGLCGLNLQPWATGVAADDAKCYPLYARCVEMGIPVTIHTGINHGVGDPIEYGRPRALDRVAADFPELTIVANHAGWPWVDELIAMAWKHGNVYLELGGVSPRYVFANDTGWAPMRRFADSVLQDRVLFATDWPVIGHDEWLSAFESVDLKPETRRKLLADNARRILEGIE